MTTETIRYTVRDRIATLTIDRPEVRNAIGPAEWQALGLLARRAEADPSVRVLLIRGQGGTFCAGGDLKTMPERLAEPEAVRRENLRRDAETILILRGIEKPVIAMVDGAAVGAGLSLALACDIRMVASDARLGALFHRVGLTGDFGLLWLLPRTVGPTRAMELLFSAETIDGARAEAIGLASRVTKPAELEQATYAYASKLCDGPSLAQKLTKQGLHLALEREFEALISFEAAAQASLSQTKDAREGVAAFLEKRPPRFSGR